ncbi:hypothetical protein [Gloeobacter morelensis]|uniref:hypothetical protein n=1 Tax=Gloeobacter morelensis TaxID=2907343 RepID=UPI001E30311F|nr:hypothetical protein [Gloeobacter morelensis]UFP97201.1 hypothetical protein ISF26_24070 [Gloeobacter morelensis MG652769]
MNALDDARFDKVLESAIAAGEGVCVPEWDHDYPGSLEARCQHLSQWLDLPVDEEEAQQFLVDSAAYLATLGPRWPEPDRREDLLNAAAMLNLAAMRLQGRVTPLPVGVLAKSRREANGHGE